MGEVAESAAAWVLWSTGDAKTSRRIRKVVQCG